jgi:hypothetical protein
MVHWETLTVIESSENWQRVGRPNWDLKARLDSLGTSGFGTKRTSQWRQLMSALWGKAEMKRKRRHFRFWTLSGQTDAERAQPNGPTLVGSTLL